MKAVILAGGEGRRLRPVTGELPKPMAPILGVPVIRQAMPVRPGRNLAIIIEVAARNLSLRRMGYYPARELNQRLFTSQADYQEEMGGIDS